MTRLRAGRRRYLGSIPGGARDFSPKRPQRLWGLRASYLTGVGGDFPPGIKRPWREADYSSSSSTEVKNAWRYLHSSICFVTCLIKHGQFYFTLYFIFLRNVEGHVTYRFVASGVTTA